MSTVQGEPITAAAEHQVSGRSMNWWGMIFFITSEALIFANLIATFLYLEIRNLPVNGWRLPNGDHLDYVYPLINTFILLASSIPARIAGAGAAKGNRRQLLGGLLGTVVLGAIFLGGQVYEYTNLIAQNFTLQFKVFGSAFFTLTGFHGLHVTVGILFLLVVFFRALRGDFSPKQHFAVEAAEMYWHFVDLVWVVVFSTVYLVPFLLG
jgi:cytochrome c oxidase subunit 3